MVYHQQDLPPVSQLPFDGSPLSLFKLQIGTSVMASTLTQLRITALAQTNSSLCIKQYLVQILPLQTRSFYLDLKWLNSQLQSLAKAKAFAPFGDPALWSVFRRQVTVSRHPEAQDLLWICFHPCGAVSLGQLTLDENLL